MFGNWLVVFNKIIVIFGLSVLISKWNLCIILIYLYFIMKNIYLCIFILIKIFNKWNLLIECIYVFYKVIIYLFLNSYISWD